MISLRLKDVDDLVIRKNFEIIQDLFNNFALYSQHLRFIELVFDKAATNFKYKHGLSFIPKDILQTSVSGPGLVTWNYTLFDATNLDLTVTDATTVRAFIGSYEGGSSP